MSSLLKRIAHNLVIAVMLLVFCAASGPLTVFAQAPDEGDQTDQNAGQANSGDPTNPTTPLDDGPVNVNDLDAINGQFPYFDPNAELECGAAAANSITLNGKDNEQNVMLFIFIHLTQLGVSAQNAAYAAAGVAGNFRQESGLNPSSNIPTKTSNPAHGIGQWEGGRWTKLQEFAAAQKKPVNDLGVQLDFLWSELPAQRSFGHLSELKAIMPSATAATSALDVLKVASSPSFAAQAFELTFERAGTPNMPNRIKFANQAYDRYGKTLAGSGVTIDEASHDTSVCNGEGTGNVNVEGYSFPLAPQTQRNYIGLPCPGPGEIPGYGAKGTVGTYNPIHGESMRIRSCHHAPLSPAFDLYYGPNRGAMPIGAAGVPIYAITDGSISHINWSYCNPSSCGASGKRCTSIDFKSSKDNFYYWYGHVLANGAYRDLSKGKGLAAGTQIGITGSLDYGPRCWGGAPHLHIDRGCHEGAKYFTGGGANCRDPEFMPLMQKLWLGLKKG